MPERTLVGRFSGGFAGGKFETELEAYKAASEADIAPKLHFSDVESKFMLTDFISNDFKFRPDSGWFFKTAGEQLKKFHSLDVKAEEGTIFTFLQPLFQKTTDLADPFGTSENLKECKAALMILEKTFSEKVKERVLVHGDMNPANILAILEMHLKIIDYETTRKGYASFDLATLGAFSIFDEFKSMTLLEAYYGRAPNEVEIAKYTLMRVPALLLSTLGLTVASQLKEKPGEEVMKKYPTDFAKFHAEIGNGNIPFGPEIFYPLAAATATQALKERQSEKYKMALELLQQQ
ncbi:MAG: phosphotransferase [Alphaproteobacteria bacterium]